MVVVGLVAYPVSAFAQRDLTEIPKPDPVAELAAMKVDPAAAANLYAADPDIRKPIQMNFDSAGGLWIASSEVYPQIQPGEKANDKIIVLRDTNGDGTGDKATVFADGLLIPTGVLPDGPNAAYVAESTRLIYLQDTDGDGKADRGRVVLSGFGTEDTHHLVHTLRWGPDGCLYFNQSIYIHSHVDTPYGSRHLDGGGIWRYRPDTGQLEVFCKGFVNPWGHVFDSVGESFATDGAYFEGINYVFPDSVFVTSPGATRWLKGMNPGSPKHCGLEILSGKHIPESWAGDFVTNDFRSHRVCRFTVRPAGSGYIGRQQPEIITTPHVAFRPIDARMGPDGAIYVADWYNPIIQHGEVDFRDDRRDRKHGRIWRVSFPSRPLDRWPNFESLDDDQLIDALEADALAVRQFARQELWGRAKAAPEAVMKKLRSWRDRSPSPQRGLEVLWMNEVLSQVSLSDAQKAIALADAGGAKATRTVLRSVWRLRLNADAGSTLRNQLSELVVSRTNDEDPRVRLEAVVSNGQRTGAEAASLVAAAVSKPVDPNLDFAIWQSLRSLDQTTDGSVLAKIDWNNRWGELAFAVGAIGTPAAAQTAVDVVVAQQSSDLPAGLVSAVASAGNANQLGAVLAHVVAKKGKDLQRSDLQSLIDRTARDKTVPADAANRLSQLAKQHSDALTSSPALMDALAAAAAAWNANALEATFIQLLPDAKGETKADLIAAMGRFNSQSARQTIDRLSRDQDLATRVAATRAIASNRPRAAINAVVNLSKEDATGDAGDDLVVQLMKRKDLPALIAKRIESETLGADRARHLLRRVRTAGGNGALEAAITKAGKLSDASWKLTPELSKQLESLVKAEGNAARGEAIYRRANLQCINCHAIGTAGGLVGPNLISMGGSSQVDYIIESLLAPNAKLKEGFTTLSVLTEDGEAINGIVVGKSDESVRLRLADGKYREIDTEEITGQKPGRSLMPDGTMDGLSKRELVDLITFLSELGRTSAFTVSTQPVVRSYETLIYSNEANRRLNRTSTDTVASDDPAMQWRVITSKVDGSLPLGELDQFKQHRQTPPTSFVRFVIELPSKGAAGLELPNEGIEAWVDGKPTPVWKLKEIVLEQGKHTVVVAIDRSEVNEDLLVSLTADATN